MRQALAGEARHRAFTLRLFFRNCFVSGCDAALAGEARHGASTLRLFFHDCFVSGCDAGILLDDTAGSFTGEKEAYSNQSARCYEVIDAIKTNVEAACNCTLSCADILALAAVEGVTHANVGAFTFPSSIAHLLRSIPLRHGVLGTLIKYLTGISSPLVENSARTWTFIASRIINSCTSDVISGSLACTVLLSFLISSYRVIEFQSMSLRSGAIWVVSYVMNNGAAITVNNNDSTIDNDYSTSG